MRGRRPPGRVRKRGGGAARLQRPERRWGQRESSGVSDSAGLGGAHPGRELQAALLAEAAGAPRGSGWATSPARRLRREPEPEWSQSSDIRAPANTCERPPGPAGGGRARAPGRGWGRARGGAWSSALPGPGPRGPRLSALPRRRGAASSCPEAGYGVGGAVLRQCAQRSFKGVVEGAWGEGGEWRPGTAVTIRKTKLKSVPRCIESQVNCLLGRPPSVKDMSLNPCFVT